MFYILERGAVDVYKHSAATPNGGTVAAPSVGPLVARMTPGDIFGERALLKDEPRAATCIAASEVSCMALERAAFLEVLSAVKVSSIVSTRAAAAMADAKWAAGADGRV